MLYLTGETTEGKAPSDSEAELLAELDALEYSAGLEYFRKRNREGNAG